MAATAAVYLAPMYWRNVENHIKREILVLGVNPDERPFCVADMNRWLYMLKRPNTVVVDQSAKPAIGPRPVGTLTEINGRQVEVVADYSRGTGLIAPGSLLTSDVTYCRLGGAAPTACNWDW